MRIIGTMVFDERMMTEGISDPIGGSEDADPLVFDEDEKTFDQKNLQIEFLENLVSLGGEFRDRFQKHETVMDSYKLRKSDKGYSVIWMQGEKVALHDIFPYANNSGSQ